MTTEASRLAREYARGKSLRQLSAETGRSARYIRKQLEIARAPIRGRRTVPADPDWWRSQLAAGLSSKAIAARLGCTTVTVDRHLRGLRPPRPTPEQWLNAHSRPQGDCQIWTGSHDSQSYGTWEVDGRRLLVHRVAWEMHHGPVPDGSVVAHQCAHRDCINLDHLFLTDPANRAAITTELGRMARGEQHWNHVLSWEKVRLIRRSPDSAAELAAQFGVSRSTIRRVRAGARWRDPPPASRNEAAG